MGKAYDKEGGNCGNMNEAAGVASNSRTDRAGAFNGGKPPSGPRPVKDMLNGVPVLPNRGVK